ncbi:DNA replication licensing factor mcm10 [Wickerhamiella sorbophila]|uniref:DNA replication licensing factor mcm10 n=1 Tax=Wickerhamiella sorbophila TaxID=45607 RepID=A0A2T0FFR9_9ASCO|nr:DNA replication licensing factor mcm10 [Wickerhamiella sorbophila]PRT53838.1 DNA replication licensing factor mcm10 [Wickerhamiella sorbophila]
MSEFANQLRAQRKVSSSTKELVKQRLGGFSTTNVGASDKKTGEQKDSVEPYTKLDLTTRYVSCGDFDALVQDVTVLTLSKLLSEVYPPLFTPPSYPNFVVMAIVARKGEAKQSMRGSKYIMLTLTDLKYDVMLAIHGASFEKFWKIRPGTLIALLNPNIYVAKGETRTLGLSIRGETSILEIGHSKHCGQCYGESSNKKRCKNWVDLRRTEFCEYHREVRLRKVAGTRPEFNSTVSKLYDPKSGAKRMTVFEGGAVKWKQGLHTDFQAPLDAGKVYHSSARGSFMGDFEETVTSKEKQVKRDKRRADELQNELRIRKKLAQRPDGFLLREFDTKGKLIDQDANKDFVEKHRAFTPEHIRRIGFDPTGGQRAKQLERHNSDSDDLEII